MGKQDYLSECNDQRVPLEDFRQQFCVRCLQTECSRSLAGVSKFEQRVHSWEERLYTQVPRLDPQDPRYPSLANQKFISIDVSRTPEIRSDWVDPLTTQVTEPAPSQVASTPTPVEPSDAPTPQKPSTNAPRHMVLANAPSQSGKMLGPVVAPQPKRDPWATPEKPDGVVVLPGARVKLGGSGV